MNEWAIIIAAISTGGLVMWAFWAGLSCGYRIGRERSLGGFPLPGRAITGEPIKIDKPVNPDDAVFGVADPHSRTRSSPPARSGFNAASRTIQTGDVGMDADEDDDA